MQIQGSLTIDGVLVVPVAYTFSVTGTQCGRDREVADLSGRRLRRRDGARRPYTPPAGAALVVDVNKNGTTIYTNQANRPSIAAGANSAGNNPP